jgi:hypothetical protein
LLVSLLNVSFGKGYAIIEWFTVLFRYCYISLSTECYFYATVPKLFPF